MAKDPAARMQTPAELLAAVTPFADARITGWEQLPPAAPPATLSDSTTPVPDTPGEPPSVESDAMLFGTLPPGMSPTPVSQSHLTSITRVSRSFEAEGRRRLLIALAWGRGIVVLAAVLRRIL